jgi:hypothetical protein
VSIRCFASFVVVCLLHAAAPAADAETRVFTVLVDGKPAGEFRLAVRTTDDDTETATATAAVQVKHLLGGYRYAYHGTEIWKAGRLQQLDAASDDNGKKHIVRAAADGGRLRVTVDGSARMGRPDVWPTTYWRMPAGATAGQSVALLDTDTGAEQPARIAAAGSQRIAVVGKEADCTRVVVAGPTPATLWYDARGRLVRQETTEDGHATVLVLREVQR